MWFIEEELKKLNKCTELRGDGFGLKPYVTELTLQEARERFRIRTDMNKIRGNYSNVLTNKMNKLVCVGCDVEGDKEVNSHVMECPAYQDLRREPLTQTEEL